MHIGFNHYSFQHGMRRGSTRNHRPEWAREAIGIGLFALAAFTAVCLATYYPLDPSINTSAAQGPLVRNAAGLVGAYLSDCLAQVFGAASYVLAVALGMMGHAVFRRKEFRSPGKAVVSSLLFLFTVAALFHLHPRGAGLLAGAPGGGIAGRFLAELAMRLFGFAGSHIVLSALALIAAMAATHLSFHALGGLFARLANAAWLGAGRGAGAVAANLARISPVALARNLYQKARNLASFAGRFDTTRDQPIAEAFQAFESAAPAPEPPPAKDPTATSPRTPMAGSSDRRGSRYRRPPLSLLDEPPPPPAKQREDLAAQAGRLESKLRDFGVEGRVVQVRPGPVVTLFEFQPASGVKVSKIVNLADDLALVMKAENVRIMAPIPGKAAVGIEIPNMQREAVYLRQILGSEEFARSTSKLRLALGKDILGRPAITDLTQIPHLLIAGATGSGKSVSVNAMICSMLFSATPDEAKLILIDPKRLEFSNYDGIPHLLTPVVTDPKKAAGVLRKVVDEMERRYELLAEHGVRHITTYNAMVAQERESRTPEDGKELELLPYVVVIIDELADLMMVSSRDVEGSLARLAQMARAAGIHLVIATQRPSVDVLTGVIKANFPARISFQVSSRVDSRTILDSIGAERLLSKGDMLFLPPTTSRLQRIHGSYVSEQEIGRLTEFLKSQGRPEYDTGLTDAFHELPIADGEYDEKHEEAVSLVAATGQASISMLQRRLRVGYNRSARMIEIMERDGIVGTTDGIKPREVYVTPETVQRYFAKLHGQAPAEPKHSRDSTA